MSEITNQPKPSDESTTGSGVCTPDEGKAPSGGETKPPANPPSGGN